MNRHNAMLPEPEILSCTFAAEVQPTMPALRLVWPETAATEPQVWDLPCGAQKQGPPPETFGIVIRRTAADRYSLRLIWDDTYLDWRQLRRKDLSESSLSLILAALKTPIEAMLDQPIAQPNPYRYLPPPERAA